MGTPAAPRNKLRKPRASCKMQLFGIFHSTSDPLLPQQTRCFSGSLLPTHPPVPPGMGTGSWPTARTRMPFPAEVSQEELSTVSTHCIHSLCTSADEGLLYAQFQKNGERWEEKEQKVSIPDCPFREGQSKDLPYVLQRASGSQM